MKNNFLKSTRWFIALVLVGLGLIIYALSHQGVQASTTPPPPSVGVAQSDDESPPQPTDAYCLLCHERPDFVWTLPAGETLSLTVDTTILKSSVHGDALEDQALACSDCHANFRYPHPKQTAQTTRDFTLERYATCRDCHEKEYLHAQDSVHGDALRNGNLDVAVCIDCHGGHDVQTPDEPRQRISLTCGKCHGAIFDEYSTSVHGSALLEESNADVPTCIDCHGVHNIGDPQTAAFRVRSPELCAQCHRDADLMDKYHISTDVFDSYLTDFHGTTVSFFDQEAPEVDTNRAVCFDCHGVHSIQEPETERIQENLLTTCQQCHPDANANFPKAWVGHYPPTLESNPLLVVSQTVYGVAIPLVGAILVLLISTDIFRRIRRRA